MRINVAIVGYGLSGQVFHAPLITADEQLHLSAVVSSKPQKVHQDYPHVTVFPSLDDLLQHNHVDLIVITTPNTTHYPFAKKALMAGKHVIVEKPFTNTYSEAVQLITLAKQKNRLLSVFHNRRWDHDFLTIQQLLESNLLGSITYFEAHYDRYVPEISDNWREKNMPGCGTLYDLGSHLIDQTLTLFGLPKTIWADIDQQRTGAIAPDYFHLVLKYDQLTAVLHSSMLVKKQGPRYQLHGDKGSFVKYGLDPQEEQLKQGMQPNHPLFGREDPSYYGNIHYTQGPLQISGLVDTLPGQYPAYYRQIAHAIQDKGPNPVPAEQAANVIRLIELAIQSAQQKSVLSYE
jgi:scyllo-inositol 2-dehydrogenase (NADP+)